MSIRGITRHFLFLSLGGSERITGFQCHARAENNRQQVAGHLGSITSCCSRKWARAQTRETAEIEPSHDRPNIFSPDNPTLRDPGAVSRAGRKCATKIYKHGQKSPWVPTLTGPFPNGEANVGSWLGIKNALYYCAQLANSISWVLFVSSYTTAILLSRHTCPVRSPSKWRNYRWVEKRLDATSRSTSIWTEKIMLLTNHNVS